MRSMFAGGLHPYDLYHHQDPAFNPNLPNELLCLEKLILTTHNKEKRLFLTYASTVGRLFNLLGGAKRSEGDVMAFGGEAVPSRMRCANQVCRGVLYVSSDFLVWS